MNLPSTPQFQNLIESTFNTLISTTLSSEIENDKEETSNVELSLNEVNISAISDSPQFENVSLIFQSEQLLPQGTYSLNHNDIDDVTLFLVPVGQKAEHYQYEAIINREKTAE